MAAFDGYMDRATWEDAVDGETNGGDDVDVNDPLTNDTSNNQGYQYDFQTIGSKNKKEGCVATGVGSYIHCDLINNHWYRNWTTSETDKDRQIDDDDADVDVPCFGYIQVMNSANDGPNSTWWGEQTSCKVAFSAYIDDREAQIAAANPPADDDDDDTTDDTTDDTNDDGAVTVFSSAAALATAAFALSF